MQVATKSARDAFFTGSEVAGSNDERLSERVITSSELQVSNNRYKVIVAGSNNKRQASAYSQIVRLQGEQR